MILWGLVSAFCEMSLFVEQTPRRRHRFGAVAQPQLPPAGSVDSESRRIR